MTLLLLVTWHSWSNTATLLDLFSCGFSMKVEMHQLRLGGISGRQWR
jgi:hypothetical protein